MSASWLLGAVASTALACLAGCGGGVFIGLGGSGNAPSVSLVADVARAAPGDAVRLVAAAVADGRIDQVVFYRIEADGSATLLGSDASPPYEWTTAVPATSRPSIGFFARAFDDIGRAGDSNTVTVELR